MDAKQKRNRVLKTAARLIAHYGFDKTTMEEIARAAGISKGALYLIWESKDALFDDVLGTEMQSLLDDLRGRLERDPQGGQMAHLYRHTLLALDANPLIRALYTHDSQILGDFVHRQDPERYTSRLLLGEDAIRQMQAAGLLREDLDAQVVAYLFAILALGFLSIGSVIPASSAPPLTAVGEGMTALVQSGLAGPADDAGAGKQAVSGMLDFMLQQYGKE